MDMAFIQAGISRMLDAFSVTLAWGETQASDVRALSGFRAGCHAALVAMGKPTRRRTDGGGGAG